MLDKELKKIGLKEKEAKVYLSLLELGPSSLTAIAQNLQMNRTSLYDVLAGLEEKQLLIVSVSGKRKVYAAETPEKLKILLKERLASINDLLPELLSITQKGKVKPTLKYLEGIEGIKSAFLDSLQAKSKTIIGFSGVEALTVENKALLRFWEKEYMPKRKKKGVKVQLIMPDSKMGKYMKENDERDLRESRLLPASSYDFSSEIYVWDDVLAFTSYSQGEEFALQIESKPIADTVRMIFRIVWNQAY